jgi:hypothetical protein
LFIHPSFLISFPFTFPPFFIFFISFLFSFYSFIYSFIHLFFFPGTGLLNFVVDDEVTASECVELLHKHNLGVETFMILDKLEKQMGEGMKYAEGIRKMQEKMREKKGRGRGGGGGRKRRGGGGGGGEEEEGDGDEGIKKEEEKEDSIISQPSKNIVSNPLLYNLFTPHSSSFLSAFFYIFRTTYVADTLEEALNLAFGGDEGGGGGRGGRGGGTDNAINIANRKKVVTVGGDLIDVSGTVSGGGGGGGEKEARRGKGRGGEEENVMARLGERDRLMLGTLVADEKYFLFFVIVQYVVCVWVLKEREEVVMGRQNNS